MIEIQHLPFFYFIRRRFFGCNRFYYFFICRCAAKWSIVTYMAVCCVFDFRSFFFFVVAYEITFNTIDNLIWKPQQTNMHRVGGERRRRMMERRFIEPCSGLQFLFQFMEIPSLLFFSPCCDFLYLQHSMVPRFTLSANIFFLQWFARLWGRQRLGSNKRSRLRLCSLFIKQTLE